MLPSVVTVWHWNHEGGTFTSRKKRITATPDSLPLPDTRTHGHTHLPAINFSQKQKQVDPPSTSLRMADSMGNPAHSLSLGNRSLTTPPAKNAWHASTSQNGSNHAGGALAPIGSADGPRRTARRYIVGSCSTRPKKCRTSKLVSLIDIGLRPGEHVRSRNSRRQMGSRH